MKFKLFSIPLALSLILIGCSNENTEVDSNDLGNITISENNKASEIEKEEESNNSNNDNDDSSNDKEISDEEELYQPRDEINGTSDEHLKTDDIWNINDNTRLMITHVEKLDNEFNIVEYVIYDDNDNSDSINAKEENLPKKVYDGNMNEVEFKNDSENIDFSLISSRMLDGASGVYRILIPRDEDNMLNILDFEINGQKATYEIDVPKY